MSSVSPVPRTYAEWVALLDRFRDGDDSGLEGMRQGSIEWTNIVAERWTRQVADALSVRLQNLSKRLQRSIDQARGDTFAISKALLDARRSLAPLWQLAALPCLDDRLRTHLTDELSRWARQSQESLEKGVRDPRRDARLLKVLRDHALTAAPTPKPLSAADQVSTTDQVSRTRRVILS